MRILKKLCQSNSIWAVALIATIGVSFGVLGLGTYNVVMDYTNNTEFCIMCHEMKQKVYPEYKQSVHYKNASGVRAGCADCHVSKEFFPKLIRKVQASKEVYHMLKGSIDSPEKFEAKRLELAKRVWAYMEETDSRECRTCHSFDAMHFDKQRPASAKKMRVAQQQGDTCISCHKGIAHQLPDMSAGYKSMYSDLQQQALAEDAQNEQLITIAAKGMYLEEEEASSGGRAVGRILAGTPVRMLEIAGDLRKVRLEGWQQEGVKQVIYAQKGKRIFSATISKKKADAIKQLATDYDEETNLSWHQVELDVWVMKSDLISDEKALWSYGAEMYTASCSTCHSAPAPDHYLANQWIGNIKAMASFISLDKSERRFLQKYLQMNAKDMVGGHS
ncbi:NapC/NirT family cytochrome c [Polycladidibacter hongkongensis]|uniref:NapC/NirT family cytochrome c n=1 Tax=Polycladidibacter hongkongensis TaxID=1647556 RepID=UPI000831BA79|nr:NapC/NirT family cytochrome c [Pseudovibrio hongkongensis]